MVKSNKDDKHEFSNVCLHDFSPSNSSSPVIKCCFFFFSLSTGRVPITWEFYNLFQERRQGKIRVTFLLFSQMPSAYDI